MKGSRSLIFHDLRIFVFIITCSLSFYSCSKIDLYEKIVPIPAHQWKGSFKPAFNFNITDTTSAYQLFLIVRHTNKYNYNNLWIRIRTSSPGGSLSAAEYELPLATNEKGWLGTEMGVFNSCVIAIIKFCCCCCNWNCLRTSRYI